MKNILLPTDLSINSKNAIDYALQLFQGELCTFYFLNVQKTSNYITDDLITYKSIDTVYNAILFNIKKELKDYVNLIRIKHKSPSHFFKELIDYDAFTDAVNQVIITKRIDLIIMGSNGASNVKEVVFGSNTLQVIRNVNCPTMVIPKGYKYNKPLNLLFVLNKKDQFDATMLEPLLDIGVKFSSTINFLKIVANDKMTFKEIGSHERIINSFKALKCNTHLITNISTVDSINSFVQLVPTDIVSIIVKKETFLKRFWGGSLVDDINYQIKTPLLFMHQ